MELKASINNVVLCFIIPPPEDRPHSSWRAICYTKTQPEKVFHGVRNLPTKIEPDYAIMKQELCDPDHIPAHVVQLTEQDQYVYIEGDVCEIIGTEIHMADGHNDPYLRQGSGATSKPSVKPKSSLILPGQQNQAGAALTRPNLITTSNMAASMGAGGPVDLKDTWIVDINFKTYPIQDAELRDKIKMVAWNHGLTL